MRLTHRLLLLAMGVLLLVSCHKEEDPRPMVMVASSPQEALAKGILPDSLIRVERLLAPGVPLETAVLTDTLFAKLANAEAFLHFETSAFEVNTITRIGREFPDISQLYVARSVPRMLTGHFTPQGSPLVDPHMILSIRNSRRMVLEGATRLAERFPKYEAEIIANADAFDNRLQQLDDSISAMLLPAYGTAFITVHPNLGYFARDYGLRQLSLVDYGMEQTQEERDSDFNHKMMKYEMSNPVVVFYNHPDEEELANKAARHLNIKAVRINLDSIDYIHNLRKAAESIINP